VKVGAIEILPVIDATYSAPPSRAYRGVDVQEAWEPHRYLLNEHGELEGSMGGFLIRGAGDRLTLVDLGLGQLEMLGIKGEGGMLDSLAEYGVAAGDITDVVLTHLHLDHIGWVSREDEVVFPNATYRCDAADWEFFVTGLTGDAPGLQSKYIQSGLAAFEVGRDVLLPARGRLETWSSDGPILPGVDALRIPGHTPGSTMLVVSDAGERAMLLGDVVHCAVELLVDEWDGFADVDPKRAKAARNALVRELEGEDMPVAAAHFPGLQFGRILYGETPRRFTFIG
jgi:glyoxylase-like metal-dependent hydrolase (beta-lactamase superfamily II)